MSDRLYAEMNANRNGAPGVAIARCRVSDTARFAGIVSLQAIDSIGIAAGVSRIVSDLGFNIDASKSFELHNFFVVNQIVSSESDRFDCLERSLAAFNKRLSDGNPLRVAPRVDSSCVKSSIRLIAVDCQGLLAAVQERIARSRGSIDSEDSETASEDEMTLFLSAIRVRHTDRDSLARMERTLAELRSEDCHIEVVAANELPRRPLATLRGTTAN